MSVCMSICAVLPSRLHVHMCSFTKPFACPYVQFLPSRLHVFMCSFTKLFACPYVQFYQAVCMSLCAVLPNCLYVYLCSFTKPFACPYVQLFPYYIFNVHGFNSLCRLSGTMFVILCTLACMFIKV